MEKISYECRVYELVDDERRVYELVDDMSAASMNW